MYSKDTTGIGGNAAIRRTVLNDGKTDPDKKGCLKNNSTLTPIYPEDKCGEGRGASSIAVKVKVKDGIIDRKIYTSGYFSHSICKYELTGNAALADFKEKVGVGDPFSVNKANKPQL